MLSKKNIDGGKAFDWGFTSQQYAAYRDIYPPELYERLRRLGVAKDGTAWLDIGTGTGILPQNLYNPNAKITGVDISEEQIRYAKQQNGNISYIVSPAENTCLPDNSFDSITAAQCFWYFDREAMKKEIRRLIKPGGKFIKIYLTWLKEDEIAAKSTALVKEFNNVWSAEASGSKDMYDDLFEDRVTEAFYCDIPFTRESWHGRMCACRGTLASMNGEQFEKWSAAHKEMLSAYPEKFTVKHKVYITYFTVK
ncbi:MAG: methyltransferase domain-containing protein [Eubacterium sp.]|nr:methyltransferase domain-containing protein [Eubacterium sp.]